MGAVNVGSASVTIVPTMNGFAGKLNKQLGSAGTSGGAAGGIVSKFKSAGTSAGAQMGAAAGAALSAKGAAIAGVAGGIASAAAQKITAALSSLTGEITNASDSAQKFASTLGFGGVDTSTIDALTASTQEYADNTVYDLGDIGNTTAQLAANGVDDYAQLAEAAGNLNAVAGGNAETFKSVGMVLTQTAGAGKLTTENWNQLADAIPGASGKLQEAMKANGAYTGNFRDAMEKGEISAEEFNQAIMQLGMTDVAKEAATSTATFEGAMGNLEASAVTAGAKVLDAFKPLLTGGMASAGEAIDGIGDSVADFLSKCQDNGAIQALSDDVSLLGGAALDVMGAVGSLVGAVLGIEPGADGAADAADSFKGALDAAHPAIQGVADAASWLRDNAAKAAPAVRALAAGFVLMKAASAVAGAVKSLSGTLTAVSTLSTFAAGGLTAMAGGETAAGTAASLSAGQVLALGAAALGPALTAGAVGMLAFGAAVLMVGAGIALATGGTAALAPMLTLVSAYGASAAIGVAALGAGMFVLGAGSLVAAAGLAALAAAAAAAVPGLMAGTPAMQGFAGACSSASGSVTSMGSSVASATEQARSGIDQTKMASQSMATAGKSAFSDFANSARSSSAAASAAVAAACARMESTVSSMRLALPRMQVGALPHFRLDGRFDAESGSVPSVAVDWYAKGGVFNSASVIGVGEAGPEAVVPLRPSVLRGIGEGIDAGGGGSEVVAWLARNLPAIISDCTPVMGEREFGRKVRKAAAYA